MLTFDHDALKDKLEALPVSHRIAFGASCCERLLPNYRAFSLQEAWGNFDLLRYSLDVIWSLLKGSQIDVREIEMLIQQCKEVIPDTENFSSNYTSAALDASASVVETLNSCITGSAENIADVGEMARDTIYLYLASRDASDLSIAQPDNTDEKKISRDPLMIEELNKQNQDIEALMMKKELTPEFLEKLRQSSSTCGIQPFLRGLL
jgi:uncharacterized protein